MTKEVHPYVAMPNRDDEPVVLGHLHRSPNVPTNTFERPVERVTNAIAGQDESSPQPQRGVQLSDLPADISAPETPEADEEPKQPVVPPA